MTLQNCEIIASVLFLLFAKIVSFVVEYYRMYNKSGSVLTSIPEKNEDEEVKKWVPKKKHEVLKAKYKCLKKLFQIYDASVIGILPETETYEPIEEEEDRRPKSRRKRSHRTKTDACAGTTEASSGDVTELSETDKASTIATAVMRDLKMTQCSYTSTQMDTIVTKSEREPTTRTSSRNDVSQKFEAISTTTNNYDYANTRKYNRSSEASKESEAVQVSQVVQPHPIPYLMMNEKPKLTRFQCFIQRVFGIRQERFYKNFVDQNGHIYAASDNNIFPPYGEKRRRRGLRLRRLRRPKKVQSESALRSARNPVILTYVQSVQKNCLMDTTPRQCPIVGCRMIFYGIINYNDHLNLCHFTERKFVCHYCHEGFEREYDKCLHENEHIGINKLTGSFSSSARQRKVSVTQTDPELTSAVPDDKLKKIVSFFDKIADPEQMLSEMKKNRYSESNLQSCKEDAPTDSSASDNCDSDNHKRTVSCVNLHRKWRHVPPTAEPPVLACNYCGETFPYSSASDNCESDKRTVSCVNLPRKGRHVPPTAEPPALACNYCGETFHYRRQLSLHVDLEHRVHDKFSKFHSCAGIINRRPNEKSKPKPPEDIHRRKSEESLTYEPSTNIVFYTSMESVDTNRGPVNYKWEPGTKIIRV